MVAKNRTRPETWWLLRNLSRPFRSRTDPVAFPIIHTPTIISGGHLKSRRGQRLESGNSSATLTHSLTSLESQRLKKVTTTSDQRDSDSVQGVNMALLTICCMTIGWACLTVNQSERRGFKCEEEKKEGLEAHFSSFPKTQATEKETYPWLSLRAYWFLLCP